MHPVKPIEETFIPSAIESLRFNKDLAERAIAQLRNDQLHESLDENTNSIAVIMKHVAGNLLSRWTGFLTSDGEKPWRDRDQEFVDTFKSRDELSEYWERGWNCFFETLNRLTPDDLSKTITIRGEPHSVPLAIHRSIAHCGYHIGQIVLVARVLAKGQWETLTIPHGESQSFNQRAWSKPSYRSAKD